MSSARAIAVVTAAFAGVLSSVASAAWPGTPVHVGRPERRRDTERDAPGINLFLYQASVDPTLRNLDLPTRRPDGTLIQRPLLGLDLHYLITFHGPGYVPDLLLGQTITTLHARPILSYDLIVEALANKGGVPGDTDLEAADIDPVHGIHLSPMHFTLEELSRLWSVFFQIPYILSFAYEATVIVLRSDDLAQPALPVTAARSALAPASVPRIEQVIPRSVEAGTDRQIVLRGQNVARGGLGARFNEGSDLTRTTPSEEGLIVPLPADLPAGVATVSLVDQAAGLTSSASSFIVRPRIVGSPAITGNGSAGRLRIQIAPPLGAGQQVAVLLNQVAEDGAAPASYTIERSASDAAAEFVEVPLQGVRPGRYLVRIEVDQASSRLYAPETGQPFDRPTVNIP